MEKKNCKISQFVKSRYGICVESIRTVPNDKFYFNCYYICLRSAPKLKCKLAPLEYPIRPFNERRMVRTWLERSSQCVNTTPLLGVSYKYVVKMVVLLWNFVNLRRNISRLTRTPITTTTATTTTIIAIIIKNKH